MTAYASRETEQNTKDHLRYEFHHTGIPTNEQRQDELFSVAADMFTSGNPGKFRIQWRRFTADSPLHSLLRSVPHPAFKVSDLTEAIADEELRLAPHEPISGYYVAIINDGGVPIELIQTDLTDDEIWGRAKSRQGALYQDGDLFKG